LLIQKSASAESVVVRLRSIILPALVAVVVAAALLLAGCGGGSSTSTGSPAKSGGGSATGTGATSAPLSGHVKIDISNFMYSPAVLEVEVGSTITITNEDETEHTATSNTEGVFDTGTLKKGQSTSFKVNKVGSFSYHCSFHAFMHGTIEVVPR
jgi:plastocyanin